MESARIRPLAGRERTESSAQGRRLVRSSFVRTSVVLFTCVCGSAAQAAKPNTPNPRLSIARFVPDNARIFVDVPRLFALDESLRRAGAWRIVPMLVGHRAAADEPPDLRSIVEGLTGIGQHVRLTDHPNLHAGFAMNSWAESQAAVSFAHLPDEAVMADWFPKHLRRGEVRSGGTTRFRTTNGARVLMRDGVLALSNPRRWGNLYGSTAKLMMNRGGKPLSELKAYRGLVSRLPAGELAFAFVSPQDRAGPSDTAGPVPWEGLKRAAIGLYENDGRLDFRIRGFRHGTHEPTTISTKSLTRLLSLPYSSLFTVATTVNFAKLSGVSQAKGGSTLARVLIHLAGFGHYASSPGELLGLLGPNVIVVWGRDPLHEGSVPQVAVMVQAARSGHVRGELKHIVGKVLELLAVVDPAMRDAPPVIQHKNHLGTRIWHVSLKEFAKKSTWPAAKLFAEVEPAWATVDDWLIVAANVTHIEQILDAGHGLIPTVATLADVQDFRDGRANLELLAFAQVGLAADLLEHWLAEHEGGAVSLLDSRWWSGRSDAGGRAARGLGIGIEGKASQGAVVVTRILPGTRAANLLELGDRILGVNGRLFSLESPMDDLQRWVKGLAADTKVELRVRRGAAIQNIVLGRPQFRLASPGNMEPAEAVRDLATLGQFLKRATFVVYAAKPAEFAARLSLQFVRAEDE